MLVRVILFTLILGGTVAVHFAWGTPEELGGPYVTFLFVFIAGLYVLNILYALLLRISDLSLLAMIQVGVDLIISAILVHFTGGADSAYTLLFLLSPVASAVTLDRRSAMLTAVIGTMVFALVIFLGYARWLPILPGQLHRPWEVKPGSLGQSFLITSAAMFAVAILAGYLSEQLRFVSERIQVQQTFIDDLAALNSDIIRCLTSGLITIDNHGRILSLNHAATEMLDLSQTLAVGQLLTRFSPELAQAVAGQEEIRRAEVTIKRDLKSKLLGISVSRLTDHRNHTLGRIINFQDLTTLKKMEEEVKRSEHLASLGRMAAGIAHEIRNPLASISGSLELLRSADQLGAEDHQLMSIALREIERLNKLITDFLEYARPKTPQFEMLDLSQEIPLLAGAIATLLNGDNAPAINIIEAPQNLWVQADRDQLSSVLWNLARNAWEAGEKNQVDIQMGQRGMEQVFLSVSDHASGISSENLDHIFEPFFTTKEKGTGLGLATVHRIVQEHGGSIEVTCKAGQGTTFTIFLPRYSPSPA